MNGSVVNTHVFYFASLLLGPGEGVNIIYSVGKSETRMYDNDFREMNTCLMNIRRKKIL